MYWTVNWWSSFAGVVVFVVVADGKKTAQDNEKQFLVNWWNIRRNCLKWQNSSWMNKYISSSRLPFISNISFSTSIILYLKHLSISTALYLKHFFPTWNISLSRINFTSSNPKSTICNSIYLQWWHHQNIPASFGSFLQTSLLNSWWPRSETDCCLDHPPKEVPWNSGKVQKQNLCPNFMFFCSHQSMYVLKLLYEKNLMTKLSTNC